MAEQGVDVCSNEMMAVLVAVAGRVIIAVVATRAHVDANCGLRWV